MARVQVPPQLARFTGGLREVDAPGRILRDVLDNLGNRFPGLRERLVEGDRLQAGLAVAVDNVLASGLLQPVGESSEVVLLPAMKGGV